MEIDDDSFIQDELDTILKKTPRSLEFLSNVEAKKVSRHRTLLTNKVIAYTKVKDPKVAS